MVDKPKILYVDDESINVKLFKIHFKRNFVVFTAESGREGLGVLNKEKGISIVVSDMEMPEMNGVEFIAEVKDKYSRMGCYLLSGYDKTPEISSALTDGLIINYFQKPYNLKMMNTEILEYLSSKILTE